jgi:segregation and condensation protein B
MGPDWDLDQTTEFLVVAATLLDLKAARLLPAAEVEDEADLALLEARDLLFARLLQYRAYKRVADIFTHRLENEARRYPRTVGLEPHHAELLPEVVISIGPEGFARLAVKAMQPRAKPQVYVDHIHAPLVSVQEQAGIVVARLRELGEASFRTLVADTEDTLTVVARFLALLELYREKAVALDRRGRGGAADGHGRVRPAARGAREGDEDVTEETVAALDLKPALEAVLMVVDEPATEEHLAKILQRPRRHIADALRELADEYTVQGRGFELRLIAGGWRFYTRPEYAAAVEGFVLDGQQARLTQAALETLAVVAYRQPVSRSRVSAVRGVNCDGVMRTLLQRGLVEEAGAEPETGAILYVTTNYFLERMGLRGLDELPELAPFLPEAEAIEAEMLEGVPSFDPDAPDADADDTTTTEL